MITRKIISQFFLAFLLAGTAQAIDFSTSQLDAYLKDVTARLRDKKVVVSVTIADARNGEVLYRLNGERPLMPASVQKIVTSVSVLKLLGPAYRFPTDIFVDRAPYPQTADGLADARPGHVGNMYVRGAGDPTLVNEQLRELAQTIRRLGVTHVKDVVMDDSLFVNPDSPTGERPFNAGLSAVSLNHNCYGIQIVPTTAGTQASVELVPNAGFSLVNRLATVAGDVEDIAVSDLAERSSYTNTKGVSFDEAFNEVPTVLPRITVRGSIGAAHTPFIMYRTVQNPTAYSGEVFKYFLKQAGVDIAGISRAGVVRPEAVFLTKYLSRDLATILKDLNLYSNNFIAGQLYFALGQDETGRFRKENSQKRIREVLSQIGVSAEHLVIVDGSGFSRDNRLSTDQLVKVLSFAYQDLSIGPPLISSLSRFGESGTLKDRKLDEEALETEKSEGPIEAEKIEYGKLVAHDIWAKTGTLDGVSSIAGYAASRYGRPLAFAIISNGGIDKNAASRIEDEVIKILLGNNA